MSPVWLELITLLCLSCTALSKKEGGGVVWRNLGETITFQCRLPEQNMNPASLTLMKGLHGEVKVLHKAANSSKTSIDPEFTGRLQLNGAFPNMDILITNLTSEDTGPYLCEYKLFDRSCKRVLNTPGKGSALVVVRDSVTKCEPNKNLVLVAVVISAVVLIGILIILVWIIYKTKTRCATVKPQRIASNDVYEDMRGTIRH